jgi:hypothetical protein
MKFHTFLISRRFAFVFFQQKEMTKRLLDQDESKHEITADEAKLYDRQIRLWGLEAQQRYQ